ncbi:MAG: hypothetical protein PSX81_09050 [bacterium]|nr:hypothetical protein [bacterium]
MEENNKEIQEAIGDVYAYATQLLVVRKMNTADALHNLMQKGIDEETARTIVNKIDDEIYEAKMKRANKDILYGALWCIGGIVITAFTYSKASSGGGKYVVTYGAIIFGMIQLVKGIYTRFE